jgi:DNA-binding PadR family transcriptional regulator
MFRGRIFKDERFFHGFGPESPFQKGDLKYVVLDLLKSKPRHGYEIIRALDERSFGFYTPSPGVIYPTLQMLEEMGYASSTTQDGKKIYSITEEGRKFLSERRDIADQVKNQMRHHWNPRHMGGLNEITREFGEIARLIGRRGRYLDADKKRRIRDVLSRALTDVKDIVEE